MRIEDRQVLFEVGDRVRFPTADGTLTGTVEKLNPVRARVRCGADVWTVPYARLDHACRSRGEERAQRVARLEGVATLTRDLMDRNGLPDWSFRFSSARQKLGECRAREKLIVLSRTHAAEGTPADVRDTILHEIAHALAGPGAGHGPAWKAIARRLGARPASRAHESDGARRAREAARTRFRLGDTVEFTGRGEVRTGVIERMNPKRARVRSGDAVWFVPYPRLRPGLPNASATRHTCAGKPRLTVQEPKVKE